MQWNRGKCILLFLLQSYNVFSEFDIILAFLVPYMKVSSEEFEHENKEQACVEEHESMP
jgi:hypothetical protein